MEQEEIEKIIKELSEKYALLEAKHAELQKSHDDMIANNIKNQPKIDGTKVDKFDVYCNNKFNKGRKQK